VTGTGTVFNNATNNLFPCIDMTNADNTGLNVTVDGGSVYSDPDPSGATTVYGYAIQTYGNVLIEGGEVYTTGRNGRCINLVGMNSNATVTDGRVTATGANGVAISTSTTNPAQVPNTTVIVSGGFVASYATESGWAIRTTGANSTVTVSGGCVFGFGEFILYNGTHPTNVPTAAPNRVIFIQGRPDASGNGFTLNTSAPTDNGVVIAWDRNSWNTPTHSRAPYNERARRHITTDPDQYAPTQPQSPTPLVPPYAVWTKPPTGYNDDGISFNFAGNTGFIPLAEVEVSARRSVRVLADSGGTIVQPASGDSPGELDPSGFVIGGVQFNGSISVMYAANPSFTMADIQVINATTGEQLRVYPEVNTYTLNNIRHDYIIIAHFNRLPPGYHTIVSFAGEGGSISNAGLVTVNDGFPGVTRTITASGGNRIADVRVDGVSVLETDDLDMNEDLTSATYYFPRITRNSVITATFASDTRTITAIANSGGRIIPFGDDPIIGSGSRDIQVPANGSRTFSIVPDEGYYIDVVHVNDEPDSARSVYEVSVTTTNRTIQAFFAPVVHDNHIITATAGSGGSIIPLGRVQGEDPDQAPIVGGSKAVEVPDGADQVFRISPSPGYRVKDVIVDDESKGPITTFPFEEVRENHTIIAEFEWVGFASPPPPAVDDEDDENGEGTPGENGEPPEPGSGNSDVSRLLVTDRHIQYIQGVGNNIFEPERNMTRAEVAQMFFNLLIEQNVEITRRFPDETNEAWHERAVHTLATLGIIEGYPDGVFRPEAPISRAEFVAVAVRFAEELPETTQNSPFSDVSLSHWSFRYIYSAVRFGWIEGYGDGTFHPARYISRAEAVTVVNRMLNRVADRAFINEHAELDRFDDVLQTHWAFYDIMEAFDEHRYHRHDEIEEWE